MDSPGSLVKIGVIAAMLVLLTWFPQALRPFQAPWGVANCWGEEPAQSTQSLESSSSGNISVGHFLLGNQANTGGSNSSEINSSFQSRGISSVQQSSGSLNNQTTVVSLGGSNRSFLSYLGVTQDNTLGLLNNDAHYSVTISGGAFSNGRGIAAVSQMAGNLNNQFTSVILNSGGAPYQSSLPTTIGISTIGNSSMVSLSNAQLSAIAVKGNNTLSLPQANNGRYSTNLDQKAFQNFSGIANVSQVSGNLNTVFSNITVNIKTLPY